MNKQKTTEQVFAIDRGACERPGSVLEPLEMQGCPHHPSAADRHPGSPEQSLLQKPAWWGTPPFSSIFILGAAVVSRSLSWGTLNGAEPPSD
jgi:hypothetical protein